jgi:hypothetical protein
MKLIYRGLSFDYDPARSAVSRSFERTHVSQTPYELIYRGNTYWVDPNALVKAFVQPITYELLYRGITYQVNRNEQGKVTAIAPIYKPFQEIRLKSIFSSLIAD